MIATVTLNLALDVTYHVARLSPHATHRVSSVAQRAGGKGVNVARILHTLGYEIVIAGLAGGAAGEAIRQELAAAGLPALLTPIAGENRRTLTVVDDAHGDATGFWEPGPETTHAEWRSFLAAYDSLLKDADAVVLSGSLPLGLPADAYAELCQRARTAGVPAVLDAEGEALRRGLTGRPALVKPNRDEIAGIVAGDDIVSAAEALREAGADAVVVSQGPDGLVAVTPAGRWRAVPSEHVAGNPTGAGDAAVAALTAGLARSVPWPDRLVDAAALSAAAVAAPLAGSFEPAVYERQRATVRLEALGDGPAT